MYLRVRRGVLHPKQGLLEGLEGVYYDPSKMYLRVWRSVLQPKQGLVEALKWSDVLQPVRRGVLHPKQGLLEGLEGCITAQTDLFCRVWGGVLQPRHAAWGVFNLQDCS
jgi:hypothetical protein